MDLLSLNLNKAEPDAPTESEVRFQVALLASVGAVAASLIARFAFDAPLLPELFAQFIFAVAPIWVVEFVVGMLGPFAKHLAFLASVVLYLIALILITIAYLKYAPPHVSAMKHLLYVSALSFSLWAITLVGVIPLLGGGLAGRYLLQGELFTSVSLLVVNLVYGAALEISSRYYLRHSQADSVSRNLVNRRRVVRGVGYAVLAVGVYDIARSLLGSWLNSGSGRVRRGNGVFPNINNLALEVTPSTDFYEVSKNAFDPQVDTERWHLEIAGMVENPIRFSYEDIKSLPAVEQYATLACISNEVGGDLIGNALWRGVRLKDLLAMAGVKQGVVDVLLRARDDYTDSIPIDRAMNDATLLVYEMNGAPLAASHGYPLRLIVPGIYGMKNVKWISRIEAIDYDFKGYWQRRGWDDRAEYKTMSRIDVPESSFKGETTIAGIAFAGDRGISKVEVSTDGGKSWREAEIKDPLSPYTWVLWRIVWTPEQAGKHAVLVRATDGRGTTQTSEYAPPDPSGSSGYHKVIVESE